MSQRWKKVALPPDNLPLVVLWKEMLAATGIPESRAWQLVQEGTFPIRQLPYHGYSPRGGQREVGRRQIDPRGFTFSKVEVLRFVALDDGERYRQTLLEWERPRCCHCQFHCPPHSAVQHALQNEVVEPVNARVVMSVDETPAVCLEEDLVAIFRLSGREMRLWRRWPDFIPFPPLPMVDRQIRVSGCVVAWFLAQDSGDYHRSFNFACWRPAP